MRRPRRRRRENGMQTRRIPTIVAIALLAAPALFTARTASAGQTWIFESVKHLPEWQVQPLEQAATRACDPGNRKGYETAPFQRCMLRLGWRFSHVRRFASPSHDEELQKRNADESNAAQQRLDEQIRSDELTRSVIESAQQLNQ